MEILDDKGLVQGLVLIVAVLVGGWSIMRGKSVGDMYIKNRPGS